MTDLDPLADTMDFDAHRAASSTSTGLSGAWRVVSFVAVVAALVVTALSVYRSRSASDVPVPERTAIALETSTVSITDLPAPAGSHLAVLGLPADESRVEVASGGTAVSLPVGLAALVSLTDDTGSLTGLAIVPADAPRPAVELSALSTARSLIVLSPGVLRPNLARSLDSLAGIEEDAAFAELVEAIRSNPDLSGDNPTLEQAYAELADRLTVDTRADQGCDSVLSSDAYPSAGTCVQPRPTGLVIENEQDRWVLVYSADDDGIEPCATVAPATSEHHDPLVPYEQCTGRALLAAPGPVLQQSDGQGLINARVRTAAAMTALYEYAGPFADLAGGSAGFTQAAVTHLRRDATEVAESLAVLIDSDEAFADATDVARRAMTPHDRHVAAITATRAIIGAADTTSLIPQRAQGESGHDAILDFFERSTERMISSQAHWRWEADAVGAADFGSEDT